MGVVYWCGLATMAPLRKQTSKVCIAELYSLRLIGGESVQEHIKSLTDVRIVSNRRSRERGRSSGVFFGQPPRVVQYADYS